MDMNVNLYRVIPVYDNIYDNIYMCIHKHICIYMCIPCPSSFFKECKNSLTALSAFVYVFIHTHILICMYILTYTHIQVHMNVYIPCPSSFFKECKKSLTALSAFTFVSRASFSSSVLPLPSILAFFLYSYDMYRYI